ncbi:MAG TPA: BatD family protein [Kofleriaceae bacterium]|jgi:hypothetical protein|nr:BatD family protein [Kofleriaceae bacterium]
MRLALVTVAALATPVFAQPNPPAPDLPVTPQPQLPGPPTQPGSGSGAGSGSSGPITLQLPPEIGMPEVRAVASPTIVKLGATFTLFVTASYGDGVEVNLRDKFELGSAFEIKPDKHDVEDRIENGKHVREWQFQVIAWDVGDLRIPPIPVTFTYAGKAAQIGTNPAPIRVYGLLGDTDDVKQLRGAAPPTPLLSRDWFWLWVAGGAVLFVIASVWLLIWRARRRRRRPVRLTGGAILVPRMKMDTPGARALERLLAIEKSGVLDRDDDRKRGYQQMVEVIREYLGARYRVATYDLTTFELIKKLAPVAPADERLVVEAWLEKCDIVKYGGLRATVETAHAVLDNARELIVATQPIVTAEVAA